MLTIIRKHGVRMKLARPDIRHPRIVLAGSADGDDAGLVAALRKRGLHAHWLAWDDPDTLTADLVILRDSSKSAEFLPWTRRVPHLLNAPQVVAWNIGRQHRQDLRDAGVPVLDRRRSDAATRTALVFLGGIQSHAFVEKSIVEADFALWDIGQAGLRAAADHLGIVVDELLYARADVIGEPGSAELVELDLVAPSLGLRLLDGEDRDNAQRRFALCVESALDRLGLGPISHRGP
jgi:predicted ATPase